MTCVKDEVLPSCKVVKNRKKHKRKRMEARYLTWIYKEAHNGTHGPESCVRGSFVISNLITGSFLEVANIPGIAGFGR